MNNVMMRLVERSIPEAVPSKKDEPAYWRRRATVLNAFFKKPLGGDLYDIKEPAKLNARPLAKLLKLTWVPPDAPVLGVTGKAVYSIYQNAARDHARVYVFLRDEVGRAKVVKRYKENRARYSKDENTDYNNDMMESYYAATDDFGVKDKVELNARYSHYVMVGFWMRRMADGTDKALFLHLQKILKAYDPGFAIKPLKPGK